MTLTFRLLASYAAVLLASLSVVTVVAFFLVENYRDELAWERLKQDTRPILTQVRSLSQTESSLNEISRALEEQAKLNDVYIFVGNATGDIVRQASPQGPQEPIELSPEALPIELSGPTEGRFSVPGDGSHLFYAVSIERFFRSRTSLNIESLVVSVPRDGVFSILADLVPAFLWAGLVGLGVSGLLAFFLARSIYKPIQQLSEATEAIARGDYDREIPVRGSKEVRGLGTGLNRMAAQARSSNQRLRFFVADVSHQLRNPLTSIRGFAQAIIDGTASDAATVQKAAQTIEDESMRMMRQVEQLLELARMQSGQVTMAHEPFDVNELLGHCQEIFAVQEKERRVEIRLKVDPLPPVVGDIDRMEQVFINLIDNAIKHSPTDGQVGITGRWTASNLIEVTVSDSGPGIPPEELPRVFERFYQADSTGGGTGLGLAIAREIVIAHRGEIEVQSQPGEGTEFTVKLPTGPSTSH